MTFNRSRWKRNHWLARMCWGCQFIHIGIKVDHNHCDYRFGDSHWQDKRVNGWHNHPDVYDHGIECTDKPKQEQPKTTESTEEGSGEFRGRDKWNDEMERKRNPRHGSTPGGGRW